MVDLQIGRADAFLASGGCLAVEQSHFDVLPVNCPIEAGANLNWIERRLNEVGRSEYAA